ncbi:MAG: hypothetical protein H0V69_03555 [Acidimicrobiia bacterium]|nr:hypothetical protein [Acidimicrobiia bacterium]
MAETLSYPDAGEDAVVGRGRGAVTGTSRWQKLIGILGVVVVVWVGGDLFDAVTGSGGGPGGGPGDQAPGDQAPGDHAPPGEAPPGEAPPGEAPPGEPPPGEAPPGGH